MLFSCYIHDTYDTGTTGYNVSQVDWTIRISVSPTKSVETGAGVLGGALAGVHGGQ